MKRVDPDTGRGRLTIFFGYAVGVGTTTALLGAARARLEADIDVVLAAVDPFPRRTAVSLSEGMERIPPGGRRGFDLHAALSRRPEILVVDDLAHVNAPGSLHRKRWQDVREILAAGIDVYTAVHVQNIESLNDVVAEITGIRVQETIPDAVFDGADRIEVVDAEPAVVLRRFAERRIYPDEGGHRNAAGCYSAENLAALRRIALSRASEHTRAVSEDDGGWRQGLRNLPSVEQLLVCVSPAPASARVIRTAARMARALEVSWVALYVETPEAAGLGGVDRDRLRDHSALVQRLRGEFVTIHGRDVVDEILSYAGIRNITKIVIGKEISRSRSPLRRRSRTLARLLEATPQQEVHVVPGRPEDYSRPPERPQGRSRFFDQMPTLSKTVFALLIFAASTALGVASFSLGFKESNIIMIFLLGVLLVSVLCGRLLGLIASVASVVSYNFLFTEPRWTFVVYDFQYLITFFVMLAVALITSELATRMRRIAQVATLRERRTEMMYRTSRSLLHAGSTRTVVRAALEHLHGLLHREVTCYLPEDRLPAGGRSPGKGPLEAHVLDHYGAGEGTKSRPVVPEEAEAARWVYEHGQPAGYGTDTLSESGTFYLPLVVQNRTLGVLAVPCREEPLDETQMNLLQAVAAQIALALDRERLARAEEENRVEIERERLRGNLLRSISHDLRSPLSTIAGASSTLLSEEGSLGPEARDDLIRGINEDATWLTGLVENLLNLTRIDVGSLRLNRSWELAEDLVASALERFRNRTGTHAVRAVLSDEPILVHVDPMLIEQVLVNIIDNALRHTPTGTRVVIRASLGDEGVAFEVADNGPGLSEYELKRAFDRFYAADTARGERRGLGLGLAISRSIVEAHGGSISVHNAAGGGAVFRFVLPRDQAPPSAHEPGGSEERGGLDEAARPERYVEPDGSYEVEG